MGGGCVLKDGQAFFDQRRGKVLCAGCGERGGE